jgi:hypothetical protein
MAADPTNSSKSKGACAASPAASRPTATAGDLAGMAASTDTQRAAWLFLEAWRRAHDDDIESLVGDIARVPRE